MKVLYFHQHFSTPQGASGTRSYEMARRLLERGHQVTLVCGSYGAGRTELVQPFVKGVRRGLVDGIDVIEFELPYLNRDGFIRRTITFLKYAWRSVLLALRHDYDLVLATSTPLTAGIPGIAASVVRRKPFVFEVRDLWPELPREMGVITNPLLLVAMSALEWVSYHTARACIGLAPGIVAGIQRRGISADRVYLVPNGCDLDLFGEAATEPWRPEGVLETDLMAVFTGAHGIANGLDAALDAAAELKRRNRNDIKLVMIGDGKLKPALMNRAQREGLDNCVFHSPVPKVKLSGLMRSADVGLMILANVPAFYFGTSPNKFFDYIASGVPVLNNYPGWLAALIEEHLCGIAVPPGDAGAFADALEKMADNRSALLEMGGNGRMLATREFDRRLLADRFVNVLEAVAPA
jgi:glycosyltransferase involved in cell wall biosynthesis